MFQTYPRPEKEYQSFSLIYNDRSLDLVWHIFAKGNIFTFVGNSFEVLSQGKNVFIEQSPFAAMNFGGVDPNHFKGKHQYALVTWKGYSKVCNRIMLVFQV